MKTLKLKLTIALALLSTTGWSQITASFFPTLPDTILMASQDGNLQLSPGGDGTGQSWDFSQFIGTDTDTVGFTDLVTTGYAADYPTAEIHKDENVVEGSFALTTFYDMQPNGAYEVGQILGSPGTPIPVEYQEEFLWLPFPSDLGTFFQDTVWMTATVEGQVVEIPADSARFERTVYRSDTIGASGSLLLSSGYYPNVLRKTTTDTWYDTIYTYSPANGWELLQTDSRVTETHYWIDSATPFTLAEMYIDDGEFRGMRARPFDPGPISYYLEIVGLSPVMTEGDLHPPFTVNIRNVSNNLLATGYSVDSIRVSGAGHINGVLSEWPSGGVATFDSVYFHTGGDFEILAYGFECEFDAVGIHVISIPDSLDFVGLPNSVNRTETVGSFEVHAFETSGDQPVLNTEWEGNVNIGKKSGDGAISGTVSKPLVNGVATFDDLSFNYADDYELVTYFINVESPDTGSITVVPDPVGEWLFTRVDTLSEYVDRATGFIWFGGFQGASAGPSTVPIWTEVGQQFDFDGSGRITEFQIHPSNYEPVGAIDSVNVKFYSAGVNKIMANDPFPGAPDKVCFVDSLAKYFLGETWITEDSLTDVELSEYFNQKPLGWALETPIEIHGPFVMTVQFNYTNGINDTLILQHSWPGDGIGEGRASRRVLNSESGYLDNDWLPEYMAQAFSETDYDFMFVPIVEIDSFQVVVSVPENDVASQVSVYPVPSQGIVTLRNLPNDLQDVSVEVINQLGQQVHPFGYYQQTSSRIALDLSKLPSGTYTILVKHQNGIIPKQVILIE